MINDILKVTKDHMHKTHEVLMHEFATVRTGRATGAVFDRVTVDAYGSPMPINQLAGIKSLDAHTLVIEPWDKSMLDVIDKAIQSSELGIMPNNDGIVLRVSFPTPTEERRVELSKQCHHFAEEARIAVRNVRRDANHKLEALKKEGGVGEDDIARAEKEVQTMTDDAIGAIDASLAAKEVEIMEV
ncbi:MAG: ribosome recycling factor [Coriobacteriia bacterium]|nr:ribosome recycling factor [Coriobacteriia bacterium]